MENALLVLIGTSLLGFIIGLAGKSRAVKIKSMQKNIFYQRVTIVSLFLMLLFAIIYSIKFKN